MASTPGPLFGRSADLAALTSLVSAGRLVTVVGPGGMGKTRLTRAFAEDTWPGAALVVHLDTCEGLNDIYTAVAVALTAQGVSVPSQGVAIGEALAERGELLLVLDNFDTLVAFGVETVAPWLKAAPSLTCLVTSRSPLSLATEQVYTLEPLESAGVPEGGPAVELFMARARRHRHDFEAELDDVEALVRALDGIPLAIELAAALVDVLTPRQILSRLDQRLQLLDAGPRDAVARHRTLRAAIEGSVRLLDEDTAEIMAWCAVFHGGFTLSAVEALMATRGMGMVQTIRAIRALKSVSLLRSMSTPTGERLSFYDSIRAFAASMLDERGARAQAEAAHRALYADGAVVLGELSPEHPGAVARIAGESANLVVVLLDASSPPVSRLIAARFLARLYVTRGPLDQVEQIFELLPTLLESEVGSAIDQFELLCLCTRQRIILGMTEHAEEMIGMLAGRLEGLESDRKIPTTTEALARAHWGWLRASVARMDGRIDEAEAGYREALDGATGALRGQVLAHFAGLMFEGGRIEEARRAFDEALPLVQAARDKAAEGEMRTNRALVLQAAGDLDGARCDLEVGLQIHRELGRRRYEGITLGDLAGLAFESGAWADADVRYAEAVQVLGRAGDRPHQGLCAEAGVAAAVLMGRRAFVEGPPVVHGPAFAEAVRIYAHGEALAQGLSAWAEGAEEALLQAEGVLEDALRAAEIWRAQSDEVRLACRVMSGVLEEVRRREQAVVVGAGGVRLKGPGGSWQDLSPRPVVARVLWGLARARRRAASGLTREEILDAGWPGEKMLPEAGTNRMHVALSTLRKMGLKGVVGKHEGVYRLEPSVPLLVVRL
ncbi:MAG: ATP-binding protein [Bradymonadia bacterium]